MKDYNRRLLINIVKFFLLIFLEAITLLFFTRHIPGMYISDFKTAFIVLLLLAIVNALLWPIISFISLRFIVFTLGFGTFILDGILLWFISKMVPGISIGIFSIFALSIFIALLSSLFSIILNFDDDFSFYPQLLKRNLQSTNQQVPSKTGYIFLEIDGLSRKVLDKAIERDDMPTLKRWINEGSHKLMSWETDLSSQTGASQAGILHGNNNDIVAFRWVEKDNDNKIVSSNGLSDAPVIEERISNKKGLLSNNGVSRSNLFSGDADDYLFTYSKLNLNDFYTESWYYLYSSPYNFAKIIVLLLADFVLEFISRIRHRVYNIKPSINRGLSYLIARGGANVVLREAAVYSLRGDILQGQKNTMYSTFMGYDEIAHHVGIEDYDAYSSLRQIDKQFKILEKTISESLRDYKIIVLSDHGQSNGPTFKQKYGITLNDLVKRHLPKNITVHSILHSNDDHFSEQLKIKKYSKNNRKRFNKRIKKSKNKLDNQWADVKINIKRLKKRHPTIFNEENIPEIWKNNKRIFSKNSGFLSNNSNNITITEEVLKEDEAQTIVLASGNLGLIYFTDWTKRLTYEQIMDAFPDLIDGLAHHPGIGFIMVKSELYGTLVLSKDSVYFLDLDKYEGDEFLSVYGENIARHLKRTDSFKYVPDILVNSKYDPEKEEVYAFEELIGSHGGAGGSQQEPFILYPTEWTCDEKIIGAENVYKFFKTQMNKKTKKEAKKN